MHVFDTFKRGQFFACVFVCHSFNPGCLEAWEIEGGKKFESLVVRAQMLQNLLSGSRKVKIVCEGCVGLSLCKQCNCVIVLNRGEEIL